MILTPPTPNPFHTQLACAAPIIVVAGDGAGAGGAAAGVAVGIGIAYARKLLNESKDEPTSPLLDGPESVRGKTPEEIRELVPEGREKAIEKECGRETAAQKNYRRLRSG